MRELYWRWPDVNVKAIGAAIGVPTGDVHKIAGPSIAVTCLDCGTEYEYAPTSRTTPAPRAGRCQPCDARRRAELDRRWAADRERREREAAELAVAVARGGYWIDARGDVVWRRGDDVSSGWESELSWIVANGHERQGECHGTTRPMNLEQAWRVGGPLILRCSACAAVHEITLVRYVDAE